MYPVSAQGVDERIINVRNYYYCYYYYTCMRIHTGTSMHKHTDYKRKFNLQVTNGALMKIAAENRKHGWSTVLETELS